MEELANAAPATPALDTGGVTQNDRIFLDAALTAAGAKVTCGGFGCGGADLSYEAHGVSYNVHLTRDAAAGNCNPAVGAGSGDDLEAATQDAAPAETEAAA